MQLSAGSASPFDNLAAVFGVRELPHAMFYEFEYALRFELGGEIYDSRTSPIPRFLQALDRARSVAHFLFDTSDHVSAIVSYSGGKYRGRRERRPSQDLLDLGFENPLGPYYKVAAEDDDELYRYWHWVDRVALSPDIDTLLWASISAEQAVTPKSRWTKIYVVDLTKGIILHVYDDRGMDVVAKRPEALLALYEQFNGWLLEWDRSKMENTFGHLSLGP
ncbi:DUF3885 domain-containing protein [Microvirga mediterraneensis]|uniref:DUF3885 domain-containing protein n=1 Tax=Microvirga mediterraneensis TaxID=2754695 RepID=A0A838BNL1_9HYPH|nr:DUF3885 domain-containing protein [Microvirga mediterraneensis]MBA1156645.1 DUF3885 domain-containing protein [Microvirga mediterraneensis]